MVVLRVLLSLLFAGLAVASPGLLQAARAGDVAKLASELDAWREAAPALSADIGPQLERHEAQLSKLAGELDAWREAAPAPSADIGSRLERHEAQLAELAGDVEALRLGAAAQVGRSF